MKTIEHRVVLDSEGKFEGGLPPHEVGLLLAELPTAVRYAISMALRSRSAQKGKRPQWLDRASDIRFRDFETKGQTTLYFDAPILGEAAEELYSQGELWPSRPDASDNGIELLNRVLTDVKSANADSERFDVPLLRQLCRFRKCFGTNFSEIRIENQPNDCRPAGIISPEVIGHAKRLYDETPDPRRVRLLGNLDSVRASNQTMELRLNEDEMVRGTLQEGSIEELARLFNRPVLVEGMAIFRASGKLLRIDVETFRPATADDRFFEKLPKPMGHGRYRFGPFDRLKMAEGLNSAFGKWPGGETDEEIEEALKELS